MRLAAWFVLNVIDDGLELLRDASQRVATRRFLKAHPDVTVYDLNRKES